MSKALNLDVIRQETKIRLYIENADKYLEAACYTDYNVRYAARVSESAGYILRELNHPYKDIILSAIAGYLRDKVNFQLRTNNTGMA
ncbi:MAG: hypothetical protein V3R54_02790 [Thermodesulfovibrionia bacterium]